MGCVATLHSGNKVYPMPASTSEPVEFLKEHGDRLFHYEVDTKNQVVSGHLVGRVLSLLET